MKPQQNFKYILDLEKKITAQLLLAHYTIIFYLVKFLTLLFIPSIIKFKRRQKCNKNLSYSIKNEHYKSTFYLFVEPL